jgi:hypothetical protein
MKLPKLDEKKFEEFKKQNFKQRLENIDRNVEWIKKNTNKKWSSEQAKMLKIK